MDKRTKDKDYLLIFVIIAGIAISLGGKKKRDLEIERYGLMQEILSTDPLDFSKKDFKHARKTVLRHMKKARKAKRLKQFEKVRDSFKNEIKNILEVQ